ncbi:MAG: alpha/beta hydrolase [Clostridia bacterium]|nr:MAG: alpha/beta hydrolase [Clostridia bacterium]
MPYVEVGGEKVFYLASPAVPASGKAVVLVHGAGGSCQRWLPQFNFLSRRYPVVVPDLPGHGRSGGQPCRDIAAGAEWLAGFLKDAGLEQAVVGGHSMGGAVALALALRGWPGLAGLMLVATGARLKVGPWFLTSLAAGAYPEAFLDWLYGPRAGDDLLQAAASELQTTDPALYLADFSAGDGFDCRQELERIVVPSLIIVGSEDRMTPVKYSSYLAENLAEARLTVIPGAGHMVMLEKPEETNMAMDDFLAGLF